jgi:hypothetical protein
MTMVGIFILYNTKIFASVKLHIKYMGYMLYLSPIPQRTGSTGDTKSPGVTPGGVPASRSAVNTYDHFFILYDKYLMFVHRLSAKYDQ